jgi:hypothetical protein
MGAGIDPGMALTPLPSSIGRGANPKPSDREPIALSLDHSFANYNFLLQLKLKSLEGVSDANPCFGM